MKESQYAKLKLFLCKGIACSKCPFLETYRGRDRCKMNIIFREKGIGPELFAIVKKNKEYFNRCKELNSEYWDDIKTLFGATLK